MGVGGRVASQVAQWVENLPAMQGTQETLVPSLSGGGGGVEDPLEEGMATCSSILDWRIHGQRSLAGYSPRGCKESDATEATEHTRTCSVDWGK